MLVVTTVLGTIFILTYVLSYVGGGLLLRYAEGATYLAIVQVSVCSIIIIINVSSIHGVEPVLWNVSVVNC